MTTINFSSQFPVFMLHHWTIIACLYCQLLHFSVICSKGIPTYPSEAISKHALHALPAYNTISQQNVQELVSQRYFSAFLHHVLNHPESLTNLTHRSFNRCIFFTTVQQSSCQVWHRFNCVLLQCHACKFLLIKTINACRSIKFIFCSGLKLHFYHEKYPLQ